MSQSVKTLGHLELIKLENAELQVHGWVASDHPTPVQHFNVTLGSKTIEGFEQILDIPSPDVNKAHPQLTNSCTARFRLVIALNSQQIDQYQKYGIAITPIFSEGKGETMVHNLGANFTVNASATNGQTSQVQPQTSKTLPSIGNLDQATITNQKLLLSGWVASLNFGAVEGFKIFIAGQEILQFEDSFGLPSPDVKKAFPKLDHAQAARFQITIPVSQSQIEEFQDAIVSLTPLFKDGKGTVMIKVVTVVGGTNKTVDYKIVDSRIILPDETSIPLPPQPLVVRVHGDSQIKGFLQAGWEINRDLKTALDRIGKEFSDFDSVLDFGCGCGRVMIWNSLLSNSTFFQGTDIDTEAISWCQQNLNFAKFSVNQTLPPTEYEDNKFDFVYLISVFTNINEEMQLQWLQELRRITKPEGIVLITTRRPNTPKEAYELATKLETEGFVSVQSVGEKRVFPDWYQTTYQTEDYVRNKWVSEFEIIDFLPGGIRGNQDIVILKNNPKSERQSEPVSVTDTKEGATREEKIVETTLLPTTGYVEQIKLTNHNELSVKGWVAAVKSGFMENMKVILGGMEIQNFQLKKAIPSPDVKQRNSHLDAETARFELSIPLNSEQLEQCRDSYISLTPFFQKGEGTVILKQLLLSLPQPKTEKETAQILDKQIQPVELSPPPTLPKQEAIEGPTLTVPQQLFSELLTEITADLEKSQTEIQEIQADLEKFKSRKTNTLAKNVFPVEQDKWGEQTPTKKKIPAKQVEKATQVLGLGEETSMDKKNPTKKLPEVDINLPGTPRKQKQELLGLSGVTVEKFWEIINPVISTEGKRGVSQPAISILTPTWNSSLDWFVETVLSVLKQSIINWEWCIVDDCSKQEEIKNVLTGLAEKEPRIKVLLSEENGNISAATNKALKMATGEFICMLDHDDTLAPTALEDSLNKLAEGFDVVYSDEDKIDFSGLNYIHPFFKPDWSPEYFRGVMYVGHLLCVRREIALAVGGFKSEFDGVQDYEFMLRVSEQTNKIAHISKHLYHWRQVQGSISGDTDAKAGIEVAQQAAINAHLERIGLAAKAEPALGRHRVNINPLPRNNYPLISLILAIPNISENLNQWLENFLSVSTYPENEVILISGNGTDNLIQNPVVKVLSLSGKFNYSRAYNLAAKTAKGEYFVFLNTNLKPAVEDWQRHLLYYAEQSDIGAVGGFLVSPNGTVEHAGIVLGKLGKVNYVMRGFSINDDGYAGSLVCAREVSAVSRDCLMVSRENFELVGGFNEYFFYDYQDVDLCLKLRKKGKQIIFTPRSVLINNESEKHRQENYDAVDYMLLLDKWQIDMDLGDPYYNVNFDIQQNNYSVVV
ncbi:MAG: glycosyltransferase [Trichodesmium sp. MAG_R03]|nr:glycosyltransferase [Trichodesmium sp. MAG_R03]